MIQVPYDFFRVSHVKTLSKQNYNHCDLLWSPSSHSLLCFAPTLSQPHCGKCCLSCSSGLSQDGLQPLAQGWEDLEGAQAAHKLPVLLEKWCLSTKVSLGSLYFCTSQQHWCSEVSSKGICLWEQWQCHEIVLWISFPKQKIQRPPI